MRPVLAPSAIFVPAQLAFAGMLAAQAEPYRTPTYEDEGPARLTVCNHGDRSVSVALGSIDVNPDDPGLTISGWTNVKAAACGAVYDFRHTASVPVRAYLAFAYFDAQGHFVPARVAAIPAIGEWLYNTTAMIVHFPAGHGPALTRATRRLCLNAGPLEYTIPGDANPDCSALHPDGVPGALVPIVAQVLFHPSARRCWRNASYEDWNCGGGRYYLDVAPRAGELELRATHGPGHEDESVAKALTPEEKARELADGVRVSLQIARSLASTGKIPVPGAHEPSSWDEVRPLFWKTPIQSVGAYQSSWLKQVVALRGTVTRVNERPMFTTVSFKESPKDGFILCAQYPNFLRRTLSVDLPELVGKTLEFTGQVEQFDGCGPGPTIRVLEPEQIRMLEAR
jgi:hypothetical protein